MTLWYYKKYNKIQNKAVVYIQYCNSTKQHNKAQNIVITYKHVVKDNTTNHNITYYITLLNTIIQNIIHYNIFHSKYTLNTLNYSVTRHITK